MHKTLFLIALWLGTFTLPTQAAQPVEIPAAVLVHVVALNALGPDEQPVTLYQQRPGLLTTLADLGRITYQVHTANLPDGAYHTLSVELAEAVTVLYADGRQEQQSLTAMGIPAAQRIHGMLWVEGGDISPLRTRPRTLQEYGRQEDDD